MATDLKPIRSEADYDEALREVERLWGERSGSPKGDRLDVLITLVEAYEDEHHPMPMGPPDPIEAVKFRMEQQGLTRRDLERLIGGPTRVAEILSRKRRLTLPMIRRLHAELGIPAEVLVQPTQIARSARPRRKAAACRS
ncbi:MAG TPA: helix-turn-helix domain-containing protein [Hyphomicrobiaceae bacterium]|nr:helix-turn-helix domain-containing protein [Hyphomicrobiaceae bacterium]